MPTSARHATARSAGGPRSRRPGQSRWCPPSTSSTTTFSGHGFASSRKPIRTTWTIAQTNRPLYGVSRRNTFRTSRAAPGIDRAGLGRLGARGRRAAERAEGDPPGDDVERVVERLPEADVLGGDHAEVHDPERDADGRDLRDREEEPADDRDQVARERELRDACQPHLATDVQQTFRPAVVLGGDGDARFRPDAPIDLEIPAVPAGVDRDQVLPRDQELHDAGEERLL